MNNVRLFLDPKNSKQNLLDKALLDNSLLTERTLGTVIQANDPVVLEKNIDNYIYLESGDHKGFTATKQGTVINGASGAFFSAPVICDSGSTTVFINCAFVQTTANTNALVQINGGAKASFINCSFRRFPLTDRARVGTVDTTNACFIALNTTAALEELVVASNIMFFSDGDSGAVEIFRNIGTGTGAGFWVIGMNNTNPSVLIGAPVLAFGVI